MNNYLMIHLLYCIVSVMIRLLMVIYPEKMEELITTKRKPESVILWKKRIMAGKI